MQTTRSFSPALDRMLTLNRAMDQALDSRWTAESRSWVPAIDVVEKKDAYVVYAELPGVDASEFGITLERNVLTIRGAKTGLVDSLDQGDVRVFAAERGSGSFERAVRLPEFVDGDRITADFKNGLLTITVPKAHAARPRRIEVNRIVERDEQISAKGQDN